MTTRKGTTELLSHLVGSLVFVGMGVAIWDEHRPAAIAGILFFGACSVTLVLFIAFPRLRYDVRRARRLAALERSPAPVPEARLRVWSALSDLYLDTDVTIFVPSIAETLAASPYCEHASP